MDPGKELKFKVRECLLQECDRMAGPGCRERSGSVSQLQGSRGLGVGGGEGEGILLDG